MENEMNIVDQIQQAIRDKEAALRKESKEYDDKGETIKGMVSHVRANDHKAMCDLIDIIRIGAMP